MKHLAILAIIFVTAGICSCARKQYQNIEHDTLSILRITDGIGIQRAHLSLHDSIRITVHTVGSGGTDSTKTIVIQRRLTSLATNEDTTYSTTSEVHSKSSIRTTAAGVPPKKPSHFISGFFQLPLLAVLAILILGLFVLRGRRR